MDFCCGAKLCACAQEVLSVLIRGKGYAVDERWTKYDQSRKYG
jgi:hypothetical protein